MTSRLAEQTSCHLTRKEESCTHVFDKTVNERLLGQIVVLKKRVLPIHGRGELLLFNFVRSISNTKCRSLLHTKFGTYLVQEVLWIVLLAEKMKNIFDQTTCHICFK